MGPDHVLIRRRHAMASISAKFSIPQAVTATVVALCALTFAAPASARSWRGHLRTGSWNLPSKDRYTETRRESRDGSSYVSNSISDWEDGPQGDVDAYVFWSGRGNSRSGSGSRRDWEEAEEVAPREDEDVLWFRRGSERYVVTDPDVLARAAK